MSLLGCLVFFLTEVLFAQILKDTILANAESSPFISILITNMGFLISGVIGFVISIMTAEQVNKKFAIGCAAIAYAINFSLWIIITYINQWSTLDQLSAVDKFGAMGRILANFSFYTLPGVTLLWFIAQFSFAIIFALLLIIVKAPVRVKQKTGGWI